MDMIARCHKFRVWPLVLVGLGICILRKKRREWRCRMRRMERRQEEMNQTLKEIRDSLKPKP